MTLTAQNSLGIRRDGASIVPILAADNFPRQRWSQHARLDADLERALPIHLTLRDCIPQGPVRDAMRRHVPRAASILDDFESGAINTRAGAIKADAEYGKALQGWLAQHLASKSAARIRSDADSVWLQAETVFWMSRILSARYNSPTIFNVIPTEVLGTKLTTYVQITEDETDEDAVIGDTFEPMGVPVSNAERGELVRKLIMYKYGATWTDREMEIEAEVRRNGRGPAWSLVDKKTSAAKRALDTKRAWIAAFGQFESKGLPGLLYGSPPAEAAEEAEYCSPDAAANVDALLALVASQESAVNYRDDQVADTLALDPASFAFLSRQQYTDGITTQQDTTLQNFMRRATGIKKVVVASEFRSQGADAVVKILPKVGGSQTMAERLSGGIRKEGEQRSVAMVYRASPDVFAHVIGTQIETVTWPSLYGRHSTVMRESTGGVVFFEPLGAAMIFRATAGDATT